MTPEQQKEILNTINQGNKNQFETSETSAVEPYIGAKALKNSAIAIVLSFLFIVVYIRLRFSALGGLASGVTAVIALVHDILIVLFIFGIFRIPVNDAFVAVTLTIIGYSINDTIVLYDRIREHRSNMKRKVHWQNWWISVRQKLCSVRSIQRLRLCYVHLSFCCLSSLQNGIYHKLLTASFSRPHFRMLLVHLHCRSSVGMVGRA